LYGRDFTLDCEKALVAHDESIELLKTCSSLGLGFALILPVKELTSYFTVLQKLLELGLARLIITIISPNEDIESLNNLLSKIYSLRSDLEVIFICDIPTQLTSGLISSETFKQFGGQMVQHPKPISVKHASVDSCATRLQLYINAEGEIFPCAGLMGCEEFSLGNICTDSTATLMTNNNYYQNISQFVRQGPSIPDFDRINTKTDEDYSLDFPWICNQHVKSLNP
jgi:sulfatase maturation enzyme AslB (radical SAM superfamily)